MRTYAYIISFLLILYCSSSGLVAQDTVTVPLNIKIAAELSGPAIYYSDKNIFRAEGYLSVDLDEKLTATLAAGYLNFKYSQYNYTYLNKGSYIRAGIDFNLLKPDKSKGRYFAGIGLRYGISRFNSEVPFIQKINYWDTTSMSLPNKVNWGHFFEVAPGVRAEIFDHLSIGWSLSLRFLVYTGTGKNLKPVYLPGYGNGTKAVSTGISYFIIWNIPYKKIKIIPEKEVPKEEEEPVEDGSDGA